MGGGDDSCADWRVAAPTVEIVAISAAAKRHALKPNAFD